ncbi:MAG TPA: response regulator transcription factor [Baekduia sp.]|uniref:response regulator transcription factor n=1 Tax=Baekduia sp. TaxID=2600305 RepID=UPI002B803222|nr:response regulator transcription factor [Baekduia sp.]HMJ36859.1 response regulator transcription factor [Baekduia sp.]
MALARQDGSRPAAAPRVVVVDDDEQLRGALRAALQDAGLVVIAEADNGRDAIDLAAHFRPDVMIMDIVMANIDGLSATHQIVERAPSVRILLFTGSDDLDLGMVGLRAGAAGHLVKGVPVSDIVAAVQRMVAGEPVVGPDLTWRLIESLRGLPVGGIGVRPVRSKLTPREWEVLDLLCAGMTVDQISDELVLARDTVRTHVKRLLRKLGAHSQAEAISIANGIRATFAATGRDA